MFTVGQADAIQKVTRKAYLSFKLRWANKKYTFDNTISIVVK